MYTEEDLASAVRAGIFSADTAAAFRHHVARQQPVADEEHFRLLSGFNDVFVVIASVLLLLAVGWIAGTLAPWCGGVAVAVTAWGLAEVFTRQRRMALPSIVLLLAFVGGTGMAGMALLAGAIADSVLVTVLASAMATAAAWLHWRRFQVPITVAAGTAALTGCVASLLLAALPLLRDWLNLIVFGAGLASFVLAMRWDSSDRQRQTRRADVAFWLHLLAAPLLVHPAFQQLAGHGGHSGVAQALLVLALYGAIALVSLCIDRRALMVSALAYVLYAFSGLLEQYGVVSLGFAITALLIGAALLTLSAFWHVCRVAVLRRIPPAWQAQLPPLQ